MLILGHSTCDCLWWFADRFFLKPQVAGGEGYYRNALTEDMKIK